MKNIIHELTNGNRLVYDAETEFAYIETPDNDEFAAIDPDELLVFAQLCITARTAKRDAVQRLIAPRAATLADIRAKVLAHGKRYDEIGV